MISKFPDCDATDLDAKLEEVLQLGQLGVGLEGDDAVARDVLRMQRDKVVPRRLQRLDRERADWDIDNVRVVEYDPDLCRFLDRFPGRKMDLAAVVHLLVVAHCRSIM